MISPNKKNSPAKLMVLTAVLFGAAQFLPVIALAAIRSYNVLDNSARPGMLMSLTSNTGITEPATDKTAAQLLGVLEADNPLLDQQPGQVYVEDSGETEVLVSTLDGPINQGDKIAPSSLAGIGTKLKESGWIVGLAQANFTDKTADAIATEVTDSTGKKRKIFIGTILVNVKVSYVTVPAKVVPVQSIVPEKLQAAADAVAGKRVSVLGLILSFTLLLIGVVIASVIVRTSVKSTFQATARQPLAKFSFFRLLRQSLLIALAIVASVLLGAYLLLKFL